MIDQFCATVKPGRLEIFDIDDTFRTDGLVGTNILVPIPDIHSIKRKEAPG
jgi:hypothetical protein